MNYLYIYHELAQACMHACIEVSECTCIIRISGLVIYNASCICLNRIKYTDDCIVLYRPVMHQACACMDVIIYSYLYIANCSSQHVLVSIVLPDFSTNNRSSSRPLFIACSQARGKNNGLSTGCLCHGWHP